MRYLFKRILTTFLLLFVAKNAWAEDRYEEKIPYVDSQRRHDHKSKIEALSLESLIENESRMRSDRAVTCTKTAIKIPIVALGQIIPGISRYAAESSHEIERTYSPDDSGDQRQASYLGFFDLFYAVDPIVLIPNFDTHFNDPVKAVFKAAFNRKDSNSNCARLTINLADVRVEIARRRGKAAEKDNDSTRYNQDKIKKGTGSQ